MTNCKECKRPLPEPIEEVDVGIWREGKGWEYRKMTLEFDRLDELFNCYDTPSSATG